MHIQFEGCEASGKTTLITQLNSYYTKLGYSITTQHFPTNNSPFGELAHKFLNQDYNFIHNHFYITLLAIADQKLYGEQVNYSSNNIFLESRGILSTLVYSELFNINWTPWTEKVLELIELISLPDLIIYIKPEISLVEDRLKQRSYFNMYDKTSFIKPILERYEAMIPFLNKKVKIHTININGEHPSGYLFNTCKNYINSYLL